MRANEAPIEGKMENELEINKANKPSTNSANEVAGRKDKGPMDKVMDKITGDPESKTTGDPQNKQRWL